MKKQINLIILLAFFSTQCTQNEEPVQFYNSVYLQKKNSGYELIRNGNPYYIRGAGGSSNFAELAEFGGNTIRLYDTIQIKKNLDEAHENNLAVIVDIPIPPHHKRYDYYSDEHKNMVLKENLKLLVSEYKDHPALLMWNLGNELYYPFVLFKKNNFIRTFNELIDIIKSEDPQHPVSTAVAGVGRLSAISIYMNSPGLDLLAYNIFSDTPNLFSKITQISWISGKKPFYISEFGANGPWESRVTSWLSPIEDSSSKKTEQIKDRYLFIENNKPPECIGTLLFYWGNKHERTYTWFSLFMDDKKLESLKTIKHLWNGTEITDSWIGLEYVLVDGKGSFDNVVFEPNQLKQSEIVFSNGNPPDVQIKWEIYPEAWSWPWWLRQDTARIDFSPIRKMERFVGFNENKATFLTPEKDGAYRLFAFAFDSEGYFATANIPFYILSRNENN
jgi:hypothetical protein